MPTSTSLIERLLHYAETDPARDAVVTSAFTLSYAELAQRVLTQVQRLDDAGISSDSIVGIRCPDDIQHLLLCLANIHVGATSFAVPSYESQQAQESVVDHCGATHVVDGDAIEPMSSDSCAASTPSGEARLLFSTSGTTGEPKLVVHYDSDLVAQAHRHIDSKQERFACLASMEHNFAKRHRLYCVAAGASNVFLDAKQESLVDQCRSLNVNVLHVTAFQAQELLAVPDVSYLSDVRLKLGGSHVPLILRQQLRAQITSNLQAGYGTTETGAIAFTDPNDGDAAESVGQALAGIEVRAVDADRKPLNIGERGELAIRCDGMFRGYLGRPEPTTDRLEDGWFYTGDIGYLDSEQRIHLCGRSDDMFMFNSMNIYPQDIETRICQFPGVSEALVLPKTSAVHGNIPVALVVFDKDVKPNLAALKAFVQKHVGVRSPRQFESVEILPRNASGKISRREALTLPERSDQIRSAIVGALSADAIKRLKPSAIAAFENGDIDITLRDAGMDSFARMEMLVMLEVDYGVVITPEEFGQFTALGDFSSWVLSPPHKDALKPLTSSASIHNTPTARRTDAQNYTLRFFQRVYGYCHTVAQLHKALTTLEHRLTPLEITFLRERYFNGQLIPSDVAEKFQTALSAWFHKVDRLMLDSGKQQPEPYVSHRITPTASHFVGPGPPAKKTLLVCFANRGSRHLMMPNAVLMQHTDSARYDLLVIAEPLIQGYRLGVPQLGRNIDEVIEWIKNLELISDYKAIRTFGCSAGAFMAVIAGYRLGAELAVSVAGRFHPERYPHRILGRVITTWRTVRKAHCARVLMSYPADKDKTRDHIYARIIGRLTGGSLFGLEFTDGRVGHRILERLVERGELAPYLANTIFAELDDETITPERANVVFSLPAGTFRPYC